VIVYADASMLVKRYLVEAGSQQVEKLLAPPTTAGTAIITRAEVSAALSKATRLGALTREDARAALGVFRTQWPDLLRLRLNEALLKRADELAWEHGLRGYDAVHLAAAAAWQSALDERLTVATYDRQLWLAAQAQDLAVWPAALA
jgi:uncharacterized protein